MIIDSIFWWLGCVSAFGSSLFALWLAFSMVFDFVYRTMKVQREFLSYLQWKRKKKLNTKFKNLNVNFDAWLKTTCFQQPTQEAYDLAKQAWKAAKECKP